MFVKHNTSQNLSPLNDITSELTTKLIQEMFIFLVYKNIQPNETPFFSNIIF